MLNKYRIIIVTVFCIFFSVTHSFSQNRTFALSISNNTTGLPVLGYPQLFYSQFHPGVDSKVSWQINKHEKNKILLDANLGFYYHQYVQFLMRIYPSISYNRNLSKSLSITAGLGAGIGLSFEGKAAFEKDEDGQYISKPFSGLRTQYLIGVSFGASYLINEESGLKLSFKLLSFMQGTYVNSYVPLLPLNVAQIGFTIPLKKQ